MICYVIHSYIIQDLLAFIWLKFHTPGQDKRDQACTIRGSFLRFGSRSGHQKEKRRILAVLVCWGNYSMYIATLFKLLPDQCCNSCENSPKEANAMLAAADYS